MPEGVTELSPTDVENAERHIESQIETTQQVERSQADRFLETSRERYADLRNRPSNMQIAADLIDFIAAKSDDVLDARENKSGWKKEVSDLSKMRQAVANSIVEGFDNHDTELKALRKLLTEQESTTSEANREIFEAFLTFLPLPATEDTTAVPTEEAIETAQVTQEQLEDFAYAPVRVNQELMKLSRKEFAKAA